MNILKMSTSFQDMRVVHSTSSTPHTYRKILQTINNQSFLHRWCNSSIYSTKYLYMSQNNQYFCENQNNKSYLNSLKSVKSSNDIIRFLVSNGIFKNVEFQLNYAFNILNISTSHISEGRILLCFYLNSNKEICNLFWDIFIDELNSHIYVSTELLKHLMFSNFNNYIIGFDMEQNQKMNIFRNFGITSSTKTTVLLTINKSTLHNTFVYDNNVIELHGAEFINNKLSFHPVPLHIGNGITLTKQSVDFKKDMNNKQIKLHTTKKITLSDCRLVTKKLTDFRLVIICKKSNLDNALAQGNIKINIKYISIAQNSDNSDDDDYVILLVATNQRIPHFSSQHQAFDMQTINAMTSLKNPNMSSSNGHKHNRSFGQYYGFGITNKYSIQSGLSFGNFRSIKKEDFQLEETIRNKLKFQFYHMMNRIDFVLPNLVAYGNQQIKDLIDFGRCCSLNETFITKTDPSNFILDGCFSTWVCKNARTELFHQEIDSSYTLIGSPINCTNVNEESNGKYKFQFRWNSIDCDNTHGIDIALFSGIALYYNGFCLFHRQVPSCPNFESMIYWNLSMYHNHRLYSSISSSIHRK